jgi:hypothetical protein
MRNYGKTAIGAHGSVNEYMLRNAYQGQDALHHQDGFNGSTVTAVSGGNITAGGVQPAGGNYVCYICHAIATYGENRAHNGIDSGNNCNGHESVGATGVNYLTGTSQTGVSTIQTYRIAGISASGAQGNLYGYSCAYCHNAGQKGFGGIHGSNASFQTYSGSGAGYRIVGRNPYRFMGGLSLKYTGPNNAAVDRWENKSALTTREGCYNLGTAADNTTAPVIKVYLWGNSGAQDGAGTADKTSASQNDGSVQGSWGACGHHSGGLTTGTAAGHGMGANFRTIQRPLSY